MHGHFQTHISEYTERERVKLGFPQQIVSEGQEFLGMGCLDIF